MAAVAVTPLYMKDVLLTLKIGAGSAYEYQGHVSEARVQVEPGEKTEVRTLCSSIGSVFSEVGKPTYSLILAGVQDWADATGTKGLARFLFDNEGATATFVLQAHGEAVASSVTKPGMTGDVKLVPGDYGGVIGEYAPLEVELPCTTKPSLKTT